jgi:hypothetical protein
LNQQNAVNNGKAMGPGGAANVLQMQKPEKIEPVIDADHDNIAAPREIAAIGDRAVEARSRAEAALAGYAAAWREMPSDGSGDYG